MQKLRDAINEIPRLAAALTQKGVGSSQVMAINLDGNGLPTLIITTQT
jgi:hypothetical protein